MSGTEVALGALIIFILLLIYVVAGSFMESRHCPFGHETGIAIIIGLAVSGVIFAIDKHTAESINFDGNIFFYVCLPPIIFASGFNMRRKRFFENIGYIMLFGILGTILTFIIFSGLTVAIFKAGFMTKYQDG
jgi:NhaP-type Na+/H+ or K+/H+ antiporter